MKSALLAARVAAVGFVASSGLSFGQLVVGASVGSASAPPPIYYLTSTDPDLAIAKPLYANATNRGVYGVAEDPVNHVLYTTTGARLNKWAEGFQSVPPTLVGGMYRLNTAGSPTATGFDDLTFANGSLYGWTSTALSGVPHGIYKVPTSTDANGRVVTTLQWAENTQAYKFEGLAYNPDDGQFYGLNDLVSGGQQLGLYSIDAIRNPNATPQFVAPYPDGYSSMDGLAIGGGKFWMSQDDEANGLIVIAGFTLATKTYDDEFLGVPFNDATHRGTGLAWTTNIVVPEPGMASLASLAGLALLRRARR